MQRGDEIGGYRIEALLGRGGMGEVHEATQISLDRRVALKVLNATLSSDLELRARFEREARHQARLDHPAVVPVHEAGEADGHLFIAMRLIDGPTLKQALTTGPLPPDRAFAVLEPVAGALDAAHAAGMVHRDVKPQNILLEDGDRPFLADFGITTDGADGLTRTGHFIGTVDYCAPERHRDDPAGPAADIYSLAVVLFETLTGALPFPRSSQTATILAHLQDPVPEIHAVDPRLPAALSAVLQRGMAKDPADRHPTAAAMISAARAALGEGQATVITPAPQTAVTARAPATPRPAPPTTELPRRRRDHRRLVAAAAALAAAAAVAVVLISGGGGGDTGKAPPADAAVAPTTTTGSATAHGRVIGADLSTPGNPTNCTGEADREACVIVQSRPVDAAAVPSAGVITAWRARSATGRVALVVLRGTPGHVVARTASAVAKPDGITTHSARIRVRRGDRIAIEMAAGAQVGLRQQRGANMQRWVPPLTKGERRVPEYDGPADLAVLVAADLEGDADGDGFGDDSQDRCPARAGSTRGC